MRKPRDSKKSLFSRVSSGVPLAKRGKILSALSALLLIPCVQAQHTPAGTTVEVLGLGAGALLGGDLTDPENDGLDAAGASADPSWNWVFIDASSEADFEGTEAAFNIFDNKIGAANDKWCCEPDPTMDDPLWVAVQFASPVGLTHFTVASGNDSPDRDPVDWAIQGSNDGTSYTDIYHFKGSPAPWTDRNQVLKFTLPAAAPAYTYLRYIAYDTPGTLHQINEIEFFGQTSGDRFTLTQPAANYREISFSANDTTTSLLDTNSVKLSIDSQAVIATVTKSGAGTTISYAPAGRFALGSQHTYSIEVKDSQGNTVTDSGNFTVPFGYFPSANLPGPAPSGNLWAVRYVWGTGETIDSLNKAITLLTNAGSSTFVGMVFDTNSATFDFGTGGIFAVNQSYAAQATNDASWTGDDFVQLGIYQLQISEEGDYTFGAHSDDGMAFRIRGAEPVSVSGNGQIDPNDPESVVHPGTTGDSNTRAVYHLAAGTYRVEFLWFERAGGDNGEFYWARGAFAQDGDRGAEWRLLGSDIAPTPLLPAIGNLPSPGVSNAVWSVRFIFGATDEFGTPIAVGGIPAAMSFITNAGSATFNGTVVDVTAPVINSVGGGIFTGDLAIPEEVVSAAGWTGDNYVMLAVGNITVEEEGDYTFGVHSDDGFALRIVGGDLISVSGNGTRDVGNTGTVVHPGTTGDSNTRAVYHLRKGIYRVEFFLFEAAGGDNAELYVAKGAFVNDADTTEWMLLGDARAGRDYKTLGLDENGVTVVSSDPGGDPLNTLADALADFEATGTGAGTNYAVVNIGDPETNAGVLAFPKNTPADNDDFALKMTGSIVVPESGTYVIGFNSDDGGYLRINGQTFIELQPGANALSIINTGPSGQSDELTCDCLTGDANTYATITLAAGTYPFEAFLIERAGGAYFRVKGFEPGAPTAAMPPLARNGAGIVHVPTALGPLTTTEPSLEEGTRVTISREGNNLTISWSPSGGTLESTTSLGANANWQPVGAANPAAVQIGTGSAVFYRVRK